MTTTSAETSAGLASGIEHFVRARVGEALRELGIVAGEPDPFDSITNFVYRLDTAQGALVAKYSVLGLSKPTLVRRLAALDGDLDRLVDAQAAYLATGQDEVRREAEDLDLLTARLGPVVARVAHHRGGVLLTRAVRDATAVTDLLAKGTEGVAAGVSPLLNAIWRIDPATVAPDHRQGMLVAGKRGIRATFARKFHGQDSAAYLRGIGLSPGSVTTATRLAPRLLAAGHPPPAATIVFGDLKPQHIMLSRSGSPVLIDPAVHVDDPATDVARLLCRTVLDLQVATASARSATLAFIAELLDDVPTARVCALVGMDALNILSTRAALAATGVHLPGWPEFPSAADLLSRLLPVLDHHAATRHPLDLCTAIIDRFDTENGATRCTGP